MKRILGILVSLFLASPAFALTIGVSGLSTFSVGSPATMSGSVAAGTVIVAQFSAANAGCGVPTVSDTVNTGNYTLLTTQFSGINQTYLFWKVANATGTPVVSSSFGGCGAKLAAIQIIGFTGTPTADASLSNTASSTGTAISIGATNNFSNEVMFVAAAVQASTAMSSGGSGWTKSSTCAQAYDCGSGTILAYSIEASASTSNPYAATISASDTWAISLGGIYDAGGASCTHDGRAQAGAFAVPTASSTVVALKSGAFGTVDCSTTSYNQQSGAFGVN